MMIGKVVRPRTSLPSRRFDVVPDDLFLGFLSLTLTRLYQVRLDEGQGHATRGTSSAGKFQRMGKARPRPRLL